MEMKCSEQASKLAETSTRRRRIALPWSARRQPTLPENVAGTSSQAKQVVVAAPSFTYLVPRHIFSGSESSQLQRPCRLS